MRSPTRFIAIALIAVSVAVICTILMVSSRDPTSLFFNPRKGYAARYSAIRHEQAESFIKLHNSTRSSKTVGSSTKNKKRTLCVGIPSIGRQDVQYVRGAVGSLLEGLTPDERNEIYVIVFIPHSDPKKHPAFAEPWLHDLTDHVLTYNDGDVNLTRIQDMEAEGGLFAQKGLQDYTYLLKKCAAQRTPYIAIFEDDTIAMDGWYHRTIAALKEAEDQTARKRTIGGFLYLRLFYTEEFLGWNSEEWATYLLYSIRVALVPSAVVLFLYIAASGTSLSRSLCSPRTLLALYASLAAIILLFFALGRMTVLPMATGVHEMAQFGCCSQALVFPRQKALQLAAYFRKHRSGFVDVLIEQFADSRNELRFAITPSVVQHVGRISSKLSGSGAISKEKVWSFVFESYDWKQLRRQHDHLLETTHR